MKLRALLLTIVQVVAWSTEAQVRDSAGKARRWLFSASGGVGFSASAASEQTYSRQQGGILYTDNFYGGTATGYFLAVAVRPAKAGIRPELAAGYVMMPIAFSGINTTFSATQHSRSETSGEVRTHWLTVRPAIGYDVLDAGGLAVGASLGATVSLATGDAGAKTFVSVAPHAYLGYRFLAAQVQYDIPTGKAYAGQPGASPDYRLKTFSAGLRLFLSRL